MTDTDMHYPSSLLLFLMSMSVDIAGLDTSESCYEATAHHASTHFL